MKPTISSFLKAKSIRNQLKSERLRETGFFPEEESHNERELKVEKGIGKGKVVEKGKRIGEIEE